MKYVSKGQVVEHHKSAVCKVHEYPVLDCDLDFVIIEINGRYPDVGCVTNEISKEIVYVQGGQGRVVVAGQTYELSAGDVILIDAHEIYYWEGQLTLHFVCTPPFKIEQHKNLPTPWDE